MTNAISTKNYLESVFPYSEYYTKVIAAMLSCEARHEAIASTGDTTLVIVTKRRDDARDEARGKGSDRRQTRFAIPLSCIPNAATEAPPQ